MAKVYKRSSYTAGTALARTLLCASLAIGPVVSTAHAAPKPAGKEDMPSSREIFGYIQDITDFGPRRTGSQANIETAAYIADKFRAAGLDDVKIEKGRTYQWSAAKWGLEVDGRAVPSFYMRHSAHPGKRGKLTTPTGGVQAELVYVGNRKDLTGIDVKGKIVVADVELGMLDLGQIMDAASTVHDPDKTLGGRKIDPFTPNNFPYNVASAMEGGAVGFVGILSNYIDSNRFYNEDLDYFMGDKPMSIPGLWVTKTDGDQLKRLASQSRKARASLVLEGAIEPVQYRTVIGFHRGRSPETVMVQSHHDSGFAGAVEDASGTAAVIALAKYYGRQPAGSRERSLMFAVMDTHFTGYESHVDLSKKYLLSGKVDAVANVTVEHIGREMTIENGHATMTGLVEPRVLLTSPALEELAGRTIKRLDYRRSMVVGTELFKHEEGIPTDVGVIQKLTGVPVISVISAPAYLYDISDTLDKVAVEELQPTALMAAGLLDALDAAPRATLERDN